MFRTKKDVDRHVQNVFSKLRNENEVRLLDRCAKIYFFFFFPCNVRTINERVSRIIFDKYRLHRSGTECVFGTYLTRYRPGKYDASETLNLVKARHAMYDDGEFSREIVVTIYNPPLSMPICDRFIHHRNFKSRILFLFFMIKVTNVFIFI